MGRDDRAAKERRARENRRARQALERRTRRAEAGSRRRAAATYGGDGDDDVAVATTAPTGDRRGAARSAGDPLAGAGVRAATMALVLAVVSSGILLVLPLVETADGGTVRLIEQYGWRALTLVLLPVALTALPLFTRRSPRSSTTWTVAAASLVVWLALSGGGARGALPGPRHRPGGRRRAAAPRRPPHGRAGGHRCRPAPLIGPWPDGRGSGEHRALGSRRPVGGAGSTGRWGLAARSGPRREPP